MEYFLKNKKIITRVVGALMLLIGFVVHFWAMPKPVMTQSDIAAANVARMEKSVARSSSHSASSKKHLPSNTPKFMEKFKDAKEKQMQFLSIFAMIFGIGFLAYSFIKRD